MSFYRCADVDLPARVIRSEDLGPPEAKYTMAELPQDLGESVSRHSIAPAHVQRAAIVAIASFLFFLATLVAFYIRQQIGYFLLSSGFLAVYLFTLVGWLMQKRNIVTVYENGLTYRKFRTAWNEINSVTANKDGLVISKSKRDQTVIPRSVTGYQQIIKTVRIGVEGRSPSK